MCVYVSLCVFVALYACVAVYVYVCLCVCVCMRMRPFNSRQGKHADHLQGDFGRRVKGELPARTLSAVSAESV